MNLFAVRKHLDKVLAPLLAWVSRLPIHANTWTLIGAAIGLAYGGIEGAAIGCLVGTVLAAIGGLVYAARWLELPIDFAAGLRIVLAVCAMSASLVLTPAPSGAVAIAAKILLGAFCYGAAILVLFPALRRFVTVRLTARFG